MINQSLLAVSSFFLPAIELEAREGFLTRQGLACCLLADGPGAAEITAETPIRYTWDYISSEKEVSTAKKALAMAGTIFRCAVILVILVLCYGRWVPGPQLYPPCGCRDPYLAFETKKSYIAWIEDPDLGVDLTGPCECTDVDSPGRIVPLTYKYSVQSDAHRMFVVDRKYPLVHLQENASSNGTPGKYGMLSDGYMSWQFLGGDGNRYTLNIRTDGKKPYFTEDTSTSPPTRERQLSQEGDPYSIAPDPQNYTVREIENKTYYIKPLTTTYPVVVTVSWFEGNYVATLHVTLGKLADYDIKTISIGDFLSRFRLEFVDLPPLQEKSFPFLWVGIAGVICLGAGICLFFVVRKVRKTKKSS